AQALRLRPTGADPIRQVAVAGGDRRPRDVAADRPPVDQRSRPRAFQHHRDLARRRTARVLACLRARHGGRLLLGRPGRPRPPRGLRAGGNPVPTFRDHALMCQSDGSPCGVRTKVELNRLIYSPIDRRPRLQWPDGARVALWLVPNVEHYEYLPRKGQMRDPWPRMPHPDVLGYSRADYGNRIGIWRTFEVIDLYQMPCTVSLNLAVYEHFPEIMQACEAREWEVLCHGIYNTDYLWGLPEDEERAIIADCVATHRRLTGRELPGWFSPAGTWTLNTPDLVAEAGIGYICDFGFDDQPFPLATRAGRLIAMPYSFDINDGINFRVNTTT